MSDYKVGYRKPPLHSRFKKGVCPNPKGRGARRPRRGIGVLREILNREVNYREGGIEKRASLFELMINRVTSDAMKGDLAAARILFGMKKHFEEHGDIQPIRMYFDQTDSEA